MSHNICINNSFILCYFAVFKENNGNSFFLIEKNNNFILRILLNI